MGRRQNEIHGGDLFMQIHSTIALCARAGATGRGLASRLIQPTAGETFPPPPREPRS